MGDIRIPLALVLYGILFVSSLPLLIAMVTKLTAFAEGRLTSAASSALSLVAIGLVAVGALYAWLRIARRLVRDKCESGAASAGPT